MTRGEAIAQVATVLEASHNVSAMFDEDFEILAAEIVDALLAKAVTEPVFGVTGVRSAQIVRIIQLNRVDALPDGEDRDAGP